MYTVCIHAKFFVYSLECYADCISSLVICQDLNHNLSHLIWPLVNHACCKRLASCAHAVASVPLHARYASDVSRQPRTRERIDSLGYAGNPRILSGNFFKQPSGDINKARASKVVKDLSCTDLARLSSPSQETESSILQPCLGK